MTDVLITGGAGYIGSTVASALADAGHRPVLLDDLSAGSREPVHGRAFYEGDIADRSLLRRIVDAPRRAGDTVGAYTRTDLAAAAIAHLLAWVDRADRELVGQG